jgi:hypothetical protein
MNGNRFILSMGGVAVAAVVANNVETKAGSIEIAGKTQGQWREYIMGRCQWSINADWLMLSSDRMSSLLQNGQTFDISSYDRLNQRTNVHGTARLESCHIRMTVGSIVKGQFVLRGNGYLFAQMSHGDFNFDFNNDFYV